MKIIIKKDVAKISIIGVGMVATPGVTFRMFQTLANEDKYPSNFNMKFKFQFNW